MTGPLNEEVRNDRDIELSRSLAFVVFIAGVIVPSCVAVVRLWVIGARNAPLFGDASGGYTDPGTDPTLWVTAILLSTVVALIAYFVVRGARHRRVLASGLVLGIFAAIAASINWTIIAG
ncbi:hypothetical protein J2X63_001775 [Agromyces sp. 3263]|uniref:hypothetical protein n=1 Tax=Agromyces sp. 3263 TaxID=2817750 RepID=UPI00285AA9F3|nr:hypothetical protein [Agromyces sp. 3263]MDR6906089.1 hypothetical protein [Agromyces sp. 3263]